MVDTVRTLDEILSLLADNSSGKISPQDVRDQTVTVFRDIVYDTVADLTASTEPARSPGSLWVVGIYRYEEAASSATNQDLTTAAGVKLYRIPDAVTNPAQLEGVIDQVAGVEGSIRTENLGSFSARSMIGNLNNYRDLPEELSQAQIRELLSLTKNFATRALFLSNDIPADVQAATFNGVHVRRDDAGLIGPTADGGMWRPAGDVGLAHFGDNTTPGTTDMTAALQATVNSFVTAGNDITANADNASVATLDLGGEQVLISSPIILGKIDVDLDGLNVIGAGYIGGVKITNGTIICGSTFNATALAVFNPGSGNVTTVPGYAIVVADYHQGSQDNQEYGITNIDLSDITIDCGYKTGGAYFENTHECKGPDTVRRLGKDAAGVMTSHSSDSSPDNTRGVHTKNGAFSLANTKIRGGYRESGEGLAAGTLPSGSVDGVCEYQTRATAGNLTLDGDQIVTGAWPGITSLGWTIGLGAAADGDLSALTFTITGTDSTGSALVEAVVGPNGTGKSRWVYTAGQFRTITSIAVSGDMGSVNIRVGATMGTIGIYIGSADSVVTNPNVSDCTTGAVLTSFTSGQFVNWHVWSRTVVIRASCNSCMFVNAYMDYTDYVFYSFSHKMIAPSQRGGSPSIILVATSVNEDGNEFLLDGYDCSGGVPLQYFVEGSGTWKADRQKRVLIGVNENGGSSTMPLLSLETGFQVSNGGDVYTNTMTLAGQVSTTHEAPTFNDVTNIGRELLTTWDATDANIQFIPQVDGTPTAADAFGYDFANTRWSFAAAPLFVNGLSLGGTTLTDFAENSYTVSLKDTSGNTSATTATGYYTRVGNLVTVIIYGLSNIDTTGMVTTDQVRITMPFTSTSTGGKRTSAPILTQDIAFTGTLMAQGLTSSDEVKVVDSTPTGSVALLWSGITTGVSDILSLTMNMRL
jgi:hypothetical protein